MWTPATRRQYSRAGLRYENQPANVQDRDGAPVVLRLSRRSFPFITKAFADKWDRQSGMPSGAKKVIGRPLKEFAPQV